MKMRTVHPLEHVLNLENILIENVFPALTVQTQLINTIAPKQVYREILFFPACVCVCIGKLLQKRETIPTIGLIF